MHLCPRVHWLSCRGATSSTIEVVSSRLVISLRGHVTQKLNKHLVCAPPPPPPLQRWSPGVPPLLHPPPPTAGHDAGLPGEPAGVHADAPVGTRVSLLVAHLRALPRQRRYRTLTASGRSNVRLHDGRLLGGEPRLHCDAAFPSRLGVSSQRTLQGAPGSRPQVSIHILGGHHTGTTRRRFSSFVV